MLASGKQYIILFNEFKKSNTNLMFYSLHIKKLQLLKQNNSLICYSVMLTFSASSRRRKTTRVSAKLKHILHFFSFMEKIL
jgi:hypothetical protein